MRALIAAGDAHSGEDELVDDEEEDELEPELEVDWLVRVRFAAASSVGGVSYTERPARAEVGFEARCEPELLDELDGYEGGNEWRRSAPRSSRACKCVARRWSWSRCSNMNQTVQPPFSSYLLDSSILALFGQPCVLNLHAKASPLRCETQ